MLSDDDIEAALTEALSCLIDTFEAGAIKRAVIDELDCRRLWVDGGDLQLNFYFAARLHEIQPSIFIQTPAGAERLQLNAVQQWLGESPKAYMFNESTLDAVCDQVADLAHRTVLRYRQDPAAARREIEAIGAAQADAFQIDEARKQAEAAWAKRDFGAAERLYAGIAGHLTAAEGKRLAFARKKRA